MAEFYDVARVSGARLAPERIRDAVRHVVAGVDNGDTRPAQMRVILSATDTPIPHKVATDAVPEVDHETAAQNAVPSAVSVPSGFGMAVVFPISADAKREFAAGRFALIAAVIAPPRASVGSVVPCA